MKHIITSLGLILFLFSCTKEEDKIQYPDLSGTWEGELSASGWDTNFYYMMELSQNENKIEGTSKIRYNDTTYARMTLTGNVKADGVFDFREQIILEKKNESNVRKWCLKSGNVKRIGASSSLTLIGTWKDVSCNKWGGNVKLRKL